MKTSLRSGCVSCTTGKRASREASQANQRCGDRDRVRDLPQGNRVEPVHRLLGSPVRLQQNLPQRQGASMTNPNLTEIVAIVDRSGSMMLVKADTEGAFDSYVADQREAAGEANLTLVQFDDRVDIVYASKPLAQVPPVQ